MLNRKILKICLLVLFMPLLSILCPIGVNAAAPVITIDPVAMTANSSNAMCFGWDSVYTLGYDQLGNRYGTSILGLGFEARTELAERFSIDELTADEVTVYVDSDDCGTTQGAGYQARVGEASNDPADNDNGSDYVTFGTSGIYETITIVLDELDGDSNNFLIPDGTSVSIGIAAVTGQSLITPTTPGNYTVVVEQLIFQDFSRPLYTEFLDTQFLYIGNANQVNITATLDPSISLVVTDTGNDHRCNFGTLTADKIQTCKYSATVTTNIGTGYTGYIEQNQPFETNVNGEATPIPGTGGNNEVDADPATLTGYGEYGIGIQTTDTTTMPTYTGDCDDYDESGSNGGGTNLPAQSLASSNTPIAFASYTAPVNGIAVTGHGVTQFCSGVRITYATPPGIYTHILTITVVGNF